MQIKWCCAVTCSTWIRRLPGETNAVDACDIY
uniref:Uncharacterized protein n=1 Tax=Arundo donax TaxID=35708 RepID=A0A0A9HCJ8_ARUDO